MTKPNLLDLTLTQLQEKITKAGFPAFRAKQLCNWFYKKHIFDLEEMLNLSKDFKTYLSKHFEISLPTIEDIAHSKSDNSYKFLLKTHDNKLIESILMLKEKHATICVSCMIGCPLACKFCATGTEIGFIRKLTTSEIVGQILAIKKYAKEHGLCERITNIVYMGMGEPFLNLEAVVPSIEILTKEYGLAMSPKRITISTACPKANIANFINKYKVKLAVSLHFPTDAQRVKQMPINKAFNLSQLITELKKINLNKQELITIEYMMQHNINDSIEHAKQLVHLLRQLNVKINLIPYNPTSKFPAQPSTEEQINEFAKYLRSKNLMVTVRRSAGQDVQGACGQFALKKKS